MDYVFSDSDGERKFASALDGASEVCAYAKLPRSFQIPTPVGNLKPTTMKKIKYEEPVGKISEMIDLYRAKIKEALEERNIAVVYFGNAPATNPNDEDYFDCYEMLRYENGEMQVL